jgi:hypothetical protein
MKRNEDQFPDQWNAMTDEDWVAMDRYAEEAHKKMKDEKGKPFIPQNSKPPF